MPGGEPQTWGASLANYAAQDSAKLLWMVTESGQRFLHELSNRDARTERLSAPVSAPMDWAHVAGERLIAACSAWTRIVPYGECGARGRG
jgi:hypothetical protein